MSQDLHPLLAAWPFEPGSLQVRLIAGADGRERLQVRLDLGILQMELTGRPDGLRPHGSVSLLDHLEEKAARSGDSIRLDAQTLAELMREGLQYYHRYMALNELDRYELVASDTERNLRLFRFVASHATDPAERWMFDQYRPFVTMMNARARGHQALAAGRPDDAIGVVDHAIQAIRAFLSEHGLEEHSSSCPELAFLNTWRADMEQARAKSPRRMLEDLLALAVACEDYHEAARIRDEIRRFKGFSPERPTASGDPDAAGR